MRSLAKLSEDLIREYDRILEGELAVSDALQRGEHPKVLELALKLNVQLRRARAAHDRFVRAVRRA